MPHNSLLIPSNITQLSRKSNETEETVSCGHRRSHFIHSCVCSQAAPDGTKENPLRVLMIPADTGTNDITQDYAPVFNGITKHYGIHFKLAAGES